MSCLPMVKPENHYCLIFEIGGGSTQLSWFNSQTGIEKLTNISLPIGVLTAISRWGNGAINDSLLQEIVNFCHPYFAEFNRMNNITELIDAGKNIQLISASGTPTTLACLHLKMNYYIRNRIDGCRFRTQDIIAIADKIRKQELIKRKQHPVIGETRMDMIAVGAALTMNILQQWNLPILDVADRGQREGLLREMLDET